MSGQATALPTQLTGSAIAPKPPSTRINSVDVMRGLTILAMVWVNDMADLVPVRPGVPQWMRHMAGNADGFTFVDLIIPTFMFLLGCSIPLAIGKRLERGDSLMSVVGHIFVRAGALIIMGLFDVNRGAPGMSPGYGVMLGWPLGLWKFLAWTFIFILWMDFPVRSEGVKKSLPLLRIAAFLGLIWLAVVFRATSGATPPVLTRFTTSWWGTLGQLGWAYLFASFTWLAFRNNRLAIIGVFVLMHAAYLGISDGLWKDQPWFMTFIGFIKRSTLTTYAANTVAGLCIGTLLGEKSGPGEKIRWALGMACFTAIAAVLLRPTGGAMGLRMPSAGWSLSATSIALVMWAALYWVTDVQAMKGMDFFRLVGQNSLLVYQLARYGIFVYWLSGLTFYEKLATPPEVGIGRSLTYALLLGVITFWATKKKIFLKV